MTDIHGTCHDRFAPVREAFESNFSERGDVGASVVVSVEGEMVEFPSVRIDMDGYVVIYETRDGAPVIPASIAHAAQAGTGTDVAVPVPGLAGVESLALGDEHSCAITSSGAISCWGRNNRGQLGDGTTTNRSTPVMVSGLGTAAQLATGVFHTCAREVSGSVRCWGDNSNGQLGDGSVAMRLTPTPVSGLSDAVWVGAGSSHTCAIREGGATLCWGLNDGGQLGDGTGTNRSVPSLVWGL